MPDVSVLIAAKDAARYIAEAITSIQAQTLPDFEVIIVDDGSEDDTFDIASRLAAEDARIQALRNEGAGVSDARNTAAFRAKADYILFADADDVQKPTRFQMQRDALASDPDLLACGGAMERFDTTEDDFLGYSRPSGRPVTDLAAFPIALAHIPMPTLAVKRAPFLEIGGFDRLFPVAEDIDLVLRLEERGSLLNLHEVVCAYRVHDESTSAKRPMDCAHFACLAMARAHLRREGRTVPASSDLKELNLTEAELQVFSAQVAVSYLNGVNRRNKPWTTEDDAMFDQVGPFLQSRSPRWFDLLQAERNPGDA